jgi:hypothetical protein
MVLNLLGIPAPRVCVLSAVWEGLNPNDADRWLLSAFGQAGSSRRFIMPWLNGHADADVRQAVVEIVSCVCCFARRQDAPPLFRHNA